MKLIGMVGTGNYVLMPLCYERDEYFDKMVHQLVGDGKEWYLYTEEHLATVEKFAQIQTRADISQRQANEFLKKAVIGGFDSKVAEYLDERIKIGIEIIATLPREQEYVVQTRDDRANKAARVLRIVSKRLKVICRYAFPLEPLLLEEGYRRKKFSEDDTKILLSGRIELCDDVHGGMV